MLAGGESPLGHHRRTTTPARALESVAVEQQWSRSLNLVCCALSVSF